MEKEMETLGYTNLTGQGSQAVEPKVGPASDNYSELKDTGADGGSNKHFSEKGLKKRQGTPTGTSKSATSEYEPESSETIPSKIKRNGLLLDNSERRRHLLDSLQRQLDEAFLELQLYEKALDLFQDDDPSTSVILHKHLLKTLAAPILDKLILTLVMDNKLQNGIEVEENDNMDSTQLSSGDHIALAKCLPGSLSAKALAAVEALEGKQVDTFMTALRAIAEESGILLRKLDKKLERTLLHSSRKDLTSQISSETDPVALLPKVIALLYLQVYNKALQAPDRAISAAVSRLKDKLPDATYKILMDYHSATVSLLALQAAATEDEEDCTSDRILSQIELLESKIPELKELVLSTTST